METRAQLCDQRPAQVVVARSPDRGLRVLFEQPTLTDRDVVWIVGFEPTQAAGAQALRQLSYEARPAGRPADPATSLVLKLSFTQVRGEARLSEVEIPEKFNAILPAPLLDAAVKVSCKAQIVAVPPGTTFDLAEVDRSTLPGRDALRQLLGTPTAANPAGTELSYRYCLAPCGTDAPWVANLKFFFGADGDLLRAEASYFRYAATVDLGAARPVATVELR